MIEVTVRVLPLLLLALPAHAQQAGAPAPDTIEAEDDASEEVTVTGARQRGSVPGSIQPELQLGPGDIRSYGVSSIADLLTELEPQTASGRGRGGRPVVLLNGRRISGFNEVRDLPTEAIQRIDILPEEAALRLGYRADQRVVNLVLRRRFNAVTGEVQAGGTTEGGRYTGAADGNLLRIARDRRLTLNLHYDRADALYEADRDVLPSPTTQGIGGAFRTLSPAAAKASANAIYSRTILGNVTATVNGSYEATTSDGAVGLARATYDVPATSPFATGGVATTVDRYLTEAGARRRAGESDAAHLGVAFNGDLGAWRWSGTGNYDRSYSLTTTDRSIDFAPLARRIAAGDPALDPFGRFAPDLLGGYAQDRARSVTDTLNYEFVASGPTLRLPAGPIASTIKAGFEANDFSASALRAGVASSSDLGRDIASAQASIDVPIASRRNAVLAGLGNLSLNGNYAIDRLSDFGSLRTSGYGVNWAPIDAIRLIVSRTDEEGAPNVGQIGNPVVVTPDVRVFDFVTGQSIDVTRIDGGNATLRADDRRVTKVGLRLSPLRGDALTLTADYTAARTLNPIASLPAPTATIAAAFPDRFVRDASGRLIRFDNRPVNFARSDEQQLRWGLNFSKRLGSPPARPEGGFRRAMREGGEAGFGRRGRGGFGRGEGGTRLRLSFYHTWRFEDSILARADTPRIDLLDGGATGSGGGQPRHEISVDAGVTHNWAGLRLSGRWQSGTTVTGGTPSAPTDLRFSPLTTLQLRAFANLTPNLSVVREHPWLRGMRVSLTVQNLFDRKLRVTDAAGLVPVNYQPDLLDPLGRTIRLSVRKLFF